MDVDLVGLITGKSGYEAGGPAMNTKEWSGFFSLKSVDEAKRRITAVASSGNVDRGGEIILPSAYKKWLPTYMANPVILAAHSHRLGDGKSPVVAKCVDAKIGKAGLVIVVEFAETKLAEEYWQLYKGKFQRAFSVGFIPHASEKQMIDGKQVRVFTEVELIEVSCVAVPANAQCLSRSAKRKREFVAGKRAATGKELLTAIRGVDAWEGRLELWNSTPKEKRAVVFSADEIAEFSKIDADGQELAEVFMAVDDAGDGLDASAEVPEAIRTLASDMVDVLGADKASRFIEFCKGDDDEINTGVTLVELVAGR